MRNACEAGAERIFVAASLRSRRYRTITVIDDGSGIPEGFVERVFEPGVTSRHWDPTPQATPTAQDPHGAGLSLYHIRSSAVSAAVLSHANPTSFHVVFDTQAFPERSLQTRPRSRRDQRRDARRSTSNLHATLKPFAASRHAAFYYASPSRILATLLQTHIIQTNESRDVYAAAGRLGLGVSLRTVQRVVSGDIEPVPPLGGEEGRPEGGSQGSRSQAGSREVGVGLRLGAEEIHRIQAILDGAARASYLAVGPLRVEARADGVVLRASVYEPEEIYDEP